MALCTVEDVRAFFSPESLTDDDISSLIALISKNIAATYNVSESSTDPNLQLACVHASTAATMRKAKLTGELASSVKSGNYQQTNAIAQDIKDHDETATNLLMKYEFNSVGLIFGRVGVNGVNNEL